MSKLVSTILLLFLCGFSMSAAERLSVAMVEPYDGKGNTNDDHLYYAVDLLLGHEMTAVKSLRVLPESSIDYAFRQLKLKRKQFLEPGQARKLGELIEARRVLWTEYRLDGKKCSFVFRVLNTATGKASKKMTVTGPDWFVVISNSVKDILHELDVTPSAEEEAQMEHWPTRSGEALDLYARSTTSAWAYKPLSETESLLHQAIAADPAFAEPLAALASIVMVNGERTNDAEEAARRAVKVRPDSAAAHLTLGTVMVVEDLNHVARDELLEAVRLKPDDLENYERLGEIYAKMNKIPEAIEALRAAIRIAPYNAKPYAELGMIFAYQGNRKEALEQLKLAEHFDPHDDTDVDLRMAQAYQGLKDVPHYVESMEKVLAMTKKVGAKSQTVEDLKKELAEWKARLSPHFLTVAEPRDYSAKELEEALRAKLTPAEFQSITNPLASTPAMNHWAAELTAGATAPQEKARRLFDGLAYHPDRSSTFSGHTAREVFEQWKNPDVDFACVDYAFLYVALARQAGLKAYFTVVKKDCDGKPVMHACACVFIDGKALLVDPAYSWFGAPHEEFAPQDDFQTIADFLSQGTDLENLRLAVKLLPKFPLGHFNYAMNLAGHRRLREAREELAAGLALEPDSPIAFIAQGCVEGNEQNLPLAEKHLRQGLSTEMEMGDARYALAMVLDAEGNSIEAREQYRKYLDGWTHADKAAAATQAIAHINETLAESRTAASSAPATK